MGSGVDLGGRRIIKKKRPCSFGNAGPGAFLLSILPRIIVAAYDTAGLAYLCTTQDGVVAWKVLPGRLLRWCSCVEEMDPRSVVAWQI